MHWFMVFFGSEINWGCLDDGVDGANCVFRLLDLGIIECDFGKN